MSPVSRARRVVARRRAVKPPAARIAVPFIDLSAQYRRIKPELDAAVQAVLEAGTYVLGEKLDAFEAAFAARCGCRTGVGVNSGTDALELALRACGIGPGDEVLVPALTFMSTALAATSIGAVPVITDIEEASNGIDVEDAARRITPRTKAILPVHLHGQPCDMDGVMALAKRHGLTVIEDCAQAIGATVRGRPVGSFGRAGCFSFYPTKNLGAAGDGGAVVTNDAHVARQLRLIRNYGTEDKVVFSQFGRNSRLDELQAAILLVKMNYLDGWNEARRERAGWYREAFAAAGPLDVRLPQELPGRRHVYHLFVVRVPAGLRDRVLLELRKRGIQAMMHYPRPLHLDSIYEGKPLKAGDLPRAETMAQELLTLPIHPELRREDVELVVTQFRAALRAAGRRR